MNPVAKIYWKLWTIQKFAPITPERITYIRWVRSLPNKEKK
jgi:hypothetical protein